MSVFRKICLAALLVFMFEMRGVVVRAEVRELPVPAQTISPRQVVKDGDLTYRKFRTTEASIRGIALDMGQIVGLQARRRLVPGRPVPLAALGKAILVERGKRTSAFFEIDGLSIRANLITLEEGSAGDVISARNLETGTAVRATVSPDGTLRVDVP